MWIVAGCLMVIFVALLGHLLDYVMPGEREDNFDEGR
jgi:hypothetical protein